MEPRTFVTRSRRSLHHAGGESLRRAVDSERVGWGRRHTVYCLGKEPLGLERAEAVYLSHRAHCVCVCVCRWMRLISRWR